jgi:hypothetical protein
MLGEGEPPKLDYAPADQVGPNRPHWSTVVLGTILLIVVLLGIATTILELLAGLLLNTSG